MSSDALLRDLARSGVQLRLAAGERLSVSVLRGGLSDSLRQRITEHKQALIECLKQRQKKESMVEALPTITPDPEHWHDPFPLADLQAGLLVGQGEEMEFHVRAHQYIEKELEDLDPVRFEAALNTALYRQRHNLPLLRPDGQLQVPREFEPVKLEIYDLRHLSEEQAQAAMLETRAQMSRQILPLDRWPTEDFRVSLYGRRRARLHINHNNFFGDGYGTERLFSMAFNQYQSPRPLPELSLSFRDCVLALAQLEESEHGQASRRYWESRVPTLPAAPPVPRRTDLNTRVRSRLTLRKMRLSQALWTHLKRHAVQFDLTPSSALIAAYAEVLSQWSGSRHFLLNNMVTRRFPLHPEVWEIFGNFASLYPLEVDWRVGGPFFERGRRLQAQVMADIRHLFTGGMKVLQALNRMQKTLGLAPCPFVVASGLFAESWEEAHYACLETPQTLIDYQFYEVGDGSLLVTWDVIEDFFPAGLIDAMQAAFESLLGQLAQDEQAWSKASFDLLAGPQRQQRALLNATRLELPDGLLHGGLATSAALNPDKPAVIVADRTLTYAELQRSANRLAHCLREAGARSGALIAIVHDKGWEQVVAAFGILASGAAYVPIDPSWPQERIDYLLSNTGAEIVVTSRRQRVPALSERLRIVFVDDEDLRRYPATPLPPVQGPDDLAYVIFTSGSTGVPKGVMISHRGALNTIADINRRFGIGASDVLFGVCSLCFDLSVYDIFGAAVTGATLVLPASSGEPDPKRWIDAVRSHGVTVWNSVPALMQLLADAAQTADIRLPSLRTVMLSGDWIPVPLPEQIRLVAPGASVISLGGATEASIWSIQYPIEKVDPAWPSIPYGKPLTNQTWHVLGESGEDSPTWVPGHLYIGGKGLALGYWRDGQKTAAAFVRHPRTGERLYRTGDLGRYLPDGNIEFLGRTDFQVKIQGYRLELGEIEAVSSQHPDVHAVAVIANSTGAGKQLVAFVVAQQGRPVEPANLQDFLRCKLPAYMVPSHIVALEQLPLTSNGKVDRSALAKLGPACESKKEFVAPRNDTERKLAAIWEDVLAVKTIGVRDDFFDLGGQSFAAVRVMTHIAEQHGRRLAISVLIEDRTIEALARRLQRHDAWSPLVQLRPIGEGAPCFFVHPAGGTVLCYRGLAEKLGRPFYGLQAPGLSGEQPPFETIEQMAALYVEAIQKIRPHGPYVLGGWSSGGTIAFEMARQIESRHEKVERVIMIDAPAPLQDAPVDDATLLLWFLEDLDLGIDLTQICRSHIPGTPENALASMLARIREQQGIDPNIDLQQLEHVFSVFRHVVRAARRYRPGPVKADISVLRAADGRVSEFADHPALIADDWGWRRFAHGDVGCAQVPGTHHTVLQPSKVDRLVAVMRTQLEAHGSIQATVGA